MYVIKGRKITQQKVIWFWLVLLSCFFLNTNCIRIMHNNYIPSLRMYLTGMFQECFVVPEDGFI